MRYLSLLLALVCLSGQAASISCKKANTITDKAICESSKLKKLDTQLSEIYDLRQNPEDSGITSAKLNYSQQLWLKRRNTCLNAQCIEQAYLERLQELSCTYYVPSGRNNIACAEANIGVLTYKVHEHVVRLRQGLTEDSSPEELDALSKLDSAYEIAWEARMRTGCQIQGVQEGGTDIWKTAFSSTCAEQAWKNRLESLLSNKSF